MPRIKDERIIKTIKLRVYTPDELKTFNDRVQKYYYDYTIQNGQDAGKKIKVLDRKKLMIAYGALTKSGAVALHNVREDGYGIVEYKRPTRMDEFTNLYDQWQRWKNKKAYGEGKRLEELEEVAQTMHIKVDPVDEEFENF